MAANNITYEYATVKAKLANQSLYSDCYRQFGWIPIENSDIRYSDLDTVEMKFKRDRRMSNRSDIKKLQNECVAAIQAIERFEKKKNIRLMSTSLGVGIVGLAFITAAIYGYTIGSFALCIIAAIPGISCCALPYFLYRNIDSKQTALIDPLIEEQYDVIYAKCEDAIGILDNK